MKIKNKLTILVLSIALMLPLIAQAQDRQLTRDGDAPTQKRVALVIGNGTYQKTTALANPVNDATDITKALKDLGFEVISGTNQTKQQMESLIRKFGNRLADTKAVGLFFYAGHGVSSGGTNYLIPVDADIQAEDEIEYASVNVNFVLNKMAAANNGFNMVVLDACRNNPFARKWRNYRDIGDKGGLARIDAPTGTLIAYATKPGDVASDGTGRNGLYTSALLKQMRVKNVEMGKMFQRVRADVIQQSNGKQVPFDESSVVGDFYFAGTETVTSASSINPKIEATENLPSAEQVLEKYFQAIGGKTAVQNLQSLLRTGEFEGTFNGNKVTGTILEIWKAPNKTYMEIKLSNGEMAQEGFDGKNGWLKGSRGFAQMTGQQLEIKRRSGEIHFIADIGRFKNLYPQIKLKGKETIKGKETLVIEAAPAVGKSDLFYFDMQTGLVSRVDYFTESSSQRGVLVPTQMFVEEYVEINGLMMPFAFHESNSGFATITRFHSFPVKFNVPIDESKFQIPQNTGKTIAETTKEFEKAESLVNEARGLAAQQHYDESIALCNKAIEISPRFERGYSERGFAYIQKGLYDKAITDYSTAAKINPNNSILFFNRAMAYYKKSDFASAIEDFNRAIELSPNSLNYLSSRCAAFFVTGKYNQAVEDCSKAIELDKTKSSLYYDRAVVYDKMGRKDLADADRKKMQELTKK